MSEVTPPRCHCSAFCDDRVGIDHRHEVLGNRPQQIDRRGPILKIDPRGENPNAVPVGVQVIGGTELPSLLAGPQEPVIAEVIVDIRYQDVDRYPAKEFGAVVSGLRSVGIDGINDFKVAAVLIPVIMFGNRHRRHERNPIRSLPSLSYPVEAPGQEHCMASRLNQFVARRFDARRGGNVHGNGLPSLHRVFVQLLRELRDRKVAC